jgi:hypothetical protein
VKTPLDLYLHIRELTGKSILPDHPFYTTYQPLAALRAWFDSRFVSRLAPVQAPSGRAPLSTDAAWPLGICNVAMSCQLAFLWALLAEKNKDTALAKAAADLAGYLSPIVSEGLTTLWSREREYQAEEVRFSTDLLKRAMGRVVLSDIDAWPSLFQENIAITPSPDVLSDPSIGYELLRTDGLAVAVSASGWQTGAGAARIGELSILSFGPHVAPLSNPELYGIGPGEDGWCSVHAAKEVWLRTRATVEPRKLNFFIDSAGAETSLPVAYVFYIRADECLVGGRSFKPRTLPRFHGEADKIEFRIKSSKIMFSCASRLKMDIIPLAEDRAFWGASFLLAVWLPPFHATTHFQLEQ